MCNFHSVAIVGIGVTHNLLDPRGIGVNGDVPAPKDVPASRGSGATKDASKRIRTDEENG